VALALVASNLRIAITSIPPVVVDIKDATGWSDTQLGILTTLPVLCMGAFALIVPRLAARIGRRRMVAIAMALIAIALASRWNEDWTGLLYVSAFASGVGIAFAAGLLPGIVREQMPNSVGAVTGMWTSTMMLGAALGAAFTVPLAVALGSWGWALAVWSIPAIVAFVVWLRVERRPLGHTVTIVRMRNLPWRNPVAWSLTAYLMLNSIVFYSCVAWIAPSFAERGFTQSVSGWLFGTFTAAQVLAALILPHLVDRTGGRRIWLAGLITLTTCAVLAVGFVPTTLPFVTMIVLGATLGGGFALGLALLSQYSSDAAAAARLTAMAYFFTYTVAGLSPTFAGIIMDSVNSWPVVFSVLAGVAILQLGAIVAFRKGQHVA
jgi:CP family cyanate transporter-like MFS transporter